MQEYQYLLQQVYRSSFQYQLVYFQSSISQKQFSQYISRIVFEAPAQLLYNKMSLYRLQLTVIEIILKQFSFSQLFSAENKRRISEFEKILQQYSTALYQQSRQYNYITDLKHFIFISSDSSAESEQVVEAESINQIVTRNL